jgi:hypothetical protein
VVIKLAKTVIITLVKILLDSQLISTHIFWDAKSMKTCLTHHAWMWCSGLSLSGEQRTWTLNWKWFCSSVRTLRSVYVNKRHAYTGSKMAVPLYQIVCFTPWCTCNSCSQCLNVCAWEQICNHIRCPYLHVYV